jgi:hypothetical protein
MENIVKVKLPVAQPKNTQRATGKGLAARNYPLAGLDEAGLLLAETSYSRSAASGTPTYGACGCVTNDVGHRTSSILGISLPSKTPIKQG